MGCDSSTERYWANSQWDISSLDVLYHESHLKEKIKCKMFVVLDSQDFSKIVGIMNKIERRKKKNGWWKDFFFLFYLMVDWEMKARGRMFPFSEIPSLTYCNIHKFKLDIIKSQVSFIQREGAYVHLGFKIFQPPTLKKIDWLEHFVFLGLNFSLNYILLWFDWLRFEKKICN